MEEHLALVPLAPRPQGCSVVEGKQLTPEKVASLAAAAEACWTAILAHDLEAFAAAYLASFQAQTAMFPGMITPSIFASADLQGKHEVISVQPDIDRYSVMDGVKAWKLTGAGGGGYLALVVNDAASFCQQHSEAILLHIRRN